MAVQDGFNTGRDVTLCILRNGNILSSPANAITSWSVKPTNIKGKVTTVGGKTIPWILDGGGSGELNFNRVTDFLESFWADYTELMQSGGTAPTVAIQYYIDNADGSISTYQLQDVALGVDDLGDMAGDKLITQKASFEYGRLVKVS